MSDPKPLPSYERAVRAAPAAYHKYIGSNPLIEIPLLTVGTALTARLGSKLASPYIQKMLLAGRSPAEQAEIMRELQEEGNQSYIKNLFTVAGGALGGGYALAKHLDFSEGAGGALKGLYSRSYREDPDRMARRSAAIREKALAARTRDVPYTTGRGGMQKNNALSYSNALPPDMLAAKVPLHASLSLIETDPFLTRAQKDVTESILYGTEGRAMGKTTGKKVMDTVIDAGLGAAQGYAFGLVASRVLSLPDPFVQRLSRSGAVAGAILNTGIFSLGAD